MIVILNFSPPHRLPPHRLGASRIKIEKKHSPCSPGSKHVISDVSSGSINGSIGFRRCRLLTSIYHGHVLIATHSPVVINQLEAKQLLCFARG
jgi:hypothetical protein